MKCKKLKSIDLFHQGDLTHREAVSMEDHLSGCLECAQYLKELEQYDQLLTGLRGYSQELTNPSLFRDSVIRKIETKDKSNIALQWAGFWESLVYTMLKPAVRYSIVSVAIIIFGVFIYQQTIIVQKMESLENRIEESRNPGDTENFKKRTAESILKVRPESGSDNLQNKELLKEYRLLKLRHKLLLRMLQENYPQAYEELLKELGEVDAPPSGLNI